MMPGGASKRLPADGYVPPVVSFELYTSKLTVSYGSINLYNPPFMLKKRPADSGQSLLCLDF